MGRMLSMRGLVGFLLGGRPMSHSMKSSRSAQEYIALAKKPSVADRDLVCRELRDKSLTALWVTESRVDGENSVDLQIGAYVGSRFDCLVVISFSNYGDLCMVSYSHGVTALPRSVDLGGILSRAGWHQVPDDDITIILDENTGADVLGTFFNIF
jgi:hypothetical protein